MKRLVVITAVALGLSTSACKTPETTTPVDASGPSKPGDASLDAREAVPNWDAHPGDVTECPISGKKFEVTEKSGHFDYQGHTFVFCCSGDCLDKVQADPGKYLDALVEQAGGPAGSPDADPEPTVGGAIDDGPDA